ncbi:hypothetical protein FRB95_004600 [Tulasnella sp. JGI-2019a]|nr:hypothetical protein FRB95_004600 [Tulasnella sp. JGI-2019a]
MRPKNQSPGASSKIRSRSNAARPEPVFVTQGDRQRTFVNPPTIYFYEKSMPYYSFTNFSPHPVRLQGKKYPTSEHLFQAMKFLGHKPQIAEHIRTVGKNPRLAFNEARRFSSEVRKDWREVNVAVMDEVIRLKFEQHSALRDQLLSTGNARLVENSGAMDAFWGNGADGKGRNELGRALMRLRDHFRSGNVRI